MDRIGIIGGIGPETTVEYYRRILALYRQRNPDGSAPYIIINSLDMKKPLDMLTASKLEELVTFLSEEVERLARAGAAFAVVAANTPHLVFDAIARRSRIPLISIVEATAEAAKAAGLKRLGLLGTRFTMQASFYPDALAAREIEVILPNEEEQVYIHGKYMDELVPGIILPETRDRLMNIIKSPERPRANRWSDSGRNRTVPDSARGDCIRRPNSRYNANPRRSRRGTSARKSANADSDWPTR